MTDLPAASFIIPTYGRAATLPDTLQCALGQDHPDCEVIVATQDPEPPDFLADLAARNPARLRVLRLHPPNANAARNAAARAARGAVLLSVDDDVRFGPDYASRHAAHYVDPRIGYVMALARRRDDEPLAESLASNAALLGLDGTPRAGELVPITWAPTCCASYRRTSVERAGWFDPYFVGGVADDTDIAVRIRAAGFGGYLDTNIPLTHLEAIQGGFGTRAHARSLARELVDQRMRCYFAIKNRRILGRTATRQLISSVLRATIGICRRHDGGIGIALAPYHFLRLAWRATCDARRHR